MSDETAKHSINAEDVVAASLPPTVSVALLEQLAADNTALRSELEQWKSEAQAQAQGSDPQAATIATTTTGDTTIVQASAPAEVIMRGMPTSELLASILVGRFADKLPFNRQQGIASRSGVSVGRHVMCQWTEAASEAASAA